MMLYLFLYCNIYIALSLIFLYLLSIIGGSLISERFEACAPYLISLIGRHLILSSVFLQQIRTGFCPSVTLETCLEEIPAKLV